MFYQAVILDFQTTMKFKRIKGGEEEERVEGKYNLFSSTPLPRFVVFLPHAYPLVHNVISLLINKVIVLTKILGPRSPRNTLLQAN